jgi:hypothetical protein
MRKYLHILVLLLIATMVSTTYAKPGDGWLNQKNNSSTEELTIKWQADSLSEATAIATKQKKVIYVYFYFQSKDDFPANFNANLKWYSEARAIFSKIFVKTDRKNKIVDPELAEFFTQHKLPNSNIGVSLDYYGNFLATVSSITGKVIPTSIDDADEKMADIERDLDQRYEDATQLEKTKDKKIPDVIKAYQQITLEGYKGYPAIEKAKAKLKTLDTDATNEHNSIIRAYYVKPEDKRDPKDAIKKLEVILQTYKGLLAENLIQSSLNTFKKGEVPALFQVEENKLAPDRKTDGIYIPSIKLNMNTVSNTITSIEITWWKKISGTPDTWEQPNGQEIAMLFYDASIEISPAPPKSPNDPKILVTTANFANPMTLIPPAHDFTPHYIRMIYTDKFGFVHGFSWWR